MKEFVGFKDSYKNVDRYKYYLAGLYFNSSRFQNELNIEKEKYFQKILEGEKKKWVMKKKENMG